jgi:regulator of sigma D
MVESHAEVRKERRIGTRRTVKNLLAERQEMLVAYCRLAGLESHNGQTPLQRLLEEFCQLLMDYTAFGHFELYRRIAQGNERRGSVLAVAQGVYQRIAQSTDQAVAFNDKYDASQHPLNFSVLSDDLSVLGEHLAGRLELEDQLLGALLQDVQDQESSVR